MPSGVFPVKISELERDEAQERAAKISSQYKRKDPKPKKPNVAPYETMRERILKLSLFPSIYNKRSLLDNY